MVNMVFDPAALQCKTCGLRYSPSNMIAYSQHLDWHFRMKRREKDNAKRAESRPWYFERMDWIISDEIEDEKGKKYKSFKKICAQRVEIASFEDVDEINDWKQRPLCQVD